MSFASFQQCGYLKLLWNYLAHDIDAVAQHFLAQALLW